MLSRNGFLAWPILKICPNELIINKKCTFEYKFNIISHEWNYFQLINSWISSK